MAVKHQSRLPKLNRDANNRKALFRNQLIELIKNGSLTTTVTKAKIIKRLFDKLVTKAKQGTLSSRRNVIATLGNPASGNRLVDAVAPALSERSSGYTTIQKTNVRRGDSTTMALLKLMAVVPEPVKAVKKEEKKVIEKKAKTVKKAK